MAVALAQPHRRWATSPRAERLGYPLGRLCLAGYINEPQHDAGTRWAEIVRRYAHVIGVPLGLPRAAGTELTAGGASLAPEPDPEVIAGLRRQYDDCYAALEQAGRNTRAGRGPLEVARQICVEERNEAMLWPDRIGALRVALNALGRQLGTMRR